MPIDPNIKALIEELGSLLAGHLEVTGYLSEKLWDLVEPLLMQNNEEIDTELRAVVPRQGYVGFEMGVRLRNRIYREGGEAHLRCRRCGQVVQGFEAAMQVECCEKPNYQHIEEEIE